MPLTLEQLNTAPIGEARQLLAGLYENSPWVTEPVLEARPFASLAQLKHALARVVEAAGREAQLKLLQTCPERVGLTDGTPDERARIRQLDADYQAKFGFPFILALRGPRGSGLGKQEIIATLERRLRGQADFELQEGLRNVHRMAEIRLNDALGMEPSAGNLVWDWAEALARHTDAGGAEQGRLTLTYLSDAHRACAADLKTLMLECGFNSVELDAVGNVVGRYRSDQPGAKTLLAGSHYDTVRNAGKYDGRLGILLPLACVRELAGRGQRLPFHLEVVAFAEEEGQRYKTSFLGSSALVGQFRTEWLEQQDGAGITLRQAMQQAGLNIDDIVKLRRNPGDYLAYVEIHIEQGPVLSELNLPLGVVSSINGGVRYTVEVVGTACHAGTTPMNRRQDAAAAVAEVILAAEQRAARDGDSVATVGQLQVPHGSTNVVPGRCLFTLDLRAPSDAQRDAMVRDVLAALAQICQRRQVSYQLEETMRVAAAPSAPAWQQRWERALDALGVPLHRMPSGAGHDAMKLHDILPQAMLFVRGQNGGISHSPLESTTSDDMQLAVQAFSKLLEQLAAEF